MFTEPGEVVLDAFIGSGTTMVAAARLGRKSVGIELSEPYAEIAVRRMEAELASCPLFDPAPQTFRQKTLTEDSVG
jgi:site-specific DNA-methyltransferase (adenine-specific)